uniref:Uncharacterized protein n=1 Tax=Rhizophora mucronata TaxID=61149 RepID=A0A2P2N1Z5_RHIMU
MPLSFNFFFTYLELAVFG